MATEEVQALLAAHAPHFSLTAEGKVKCELNGHTFPARADALEAFVNGKKYAKLKKAADLDAGLTKYEPFIVRSKNLPGMLFCALTGELLGARLEEIKHHLKGRKWARAKERFDADEQELLEEPDMDEAQDMEEDDGPGIFIPEDVLREYEMGDAGEEEGEEGEEEEEEDEGGDDGAAEEPKAQEAAAAAGKGGKAAKGAKSAKGSTGVPAQEAAPKQGQQQQEGRQRGKAAARGGDAMQPAKPQQQKASGSKGKQPAAKQQQQQKQQQKEKGAAAASGGGKAKAPKAKRARTAA
ncbi:Surfeit locus 2 [Micractinium conductrix]|uniref:Surfeit locus 2 n=1 Tax=Micractinium conductrix TaxID=554055 RepID=A0A2P6V4Z0_9CHLO|nr:Surfeit locus 2 [Micractinium conductrix]|eukprot:PSC69149.1 Surfeit locus 2 [Micractinium conductrix]